ncbi:hypothetical protein [Allohahella marinimesophila]|uniref:Uncharacterized protein n=1 Tax=Allohahella marinimesophila TaxID=1054972 RepID=A0ABP7NHW8_9GAMM
MKAKIFGLNAAEVYGLDVAEIQSQSTADRLARLKAEYCEQPNPSYVTFGPKTRRDFFTMLARTRGRPG